MIHKLRRFVLDRKVYPDCGKPSQAKLVEDFNLLFDSAGYAIKRKQLPKESKDRQGQRFRLCCSKDTKKHKCTFHLTLIYFSDYGWCITLTRGQPRGKFEHSCVDVTSEGPSEENDNNASAEDEAESFSRHKHQECSSTCTPPYTPKRFTGNMANIRHGNPKVSFGEINVKTARSIVCLIEVYPISSFSNHQATRSRARLSVKICGQRN